MIRPYNVVMIDEAVLIENADNAFNGWDTETLNRLGEKYNVKAFTNLPPNYLRERISLNRMYDILAELNDFPSWR